MRLRTESFYIYVALINFRNVRANKKENMYLGSNDTFKLTILFSEQVQIQVIIFKGLR